MSRLVPMTSEQAKILDEVVVPALMRAKDERRASEMMSLALAYRFTTDVEQERPSNVVDLHKYSRKAPCA